METSLHKCLKQKYANQGSQVEAQILGYRADVLQTGRVVEVQVSGLSAISSKVEDLLQHTRVLVVKPIFRKKLLVYHEKKTGPEASRRFSPKTGDKLDLFDELVHFVRPFPHPRLTIEVPFVDVVERRVRTRARRGCDYRVLDRELLAVEETTQLTRPRDLVGFLPMELPEQFSTATIAERLNCSICFAQRVAYVLRHCGASRAAGKKGNRILYRREDEPPELPMAC